MTVVTGQPGNGQPWPAGQPAQTCGVAGLRWRRLLLQHLVGLADCERPKTLWTYPYSCGVTHTCRNYSLQLPPNYPNCGRGQQV